MRANSGAVRTETATILVAEDSDPLRELTRRVLEREGYRVLTAADGRAALSLALGHPGRLHLLLTDLAMPGLNGPQLADAVRERRPEVRVLYTSGQSSDSAAEQGVLAAGAPLLEKPWRAADLLRRVRELLRPE